MSLVTMRKTEVFNEKDKIKAATDCFHYCVIF